MGVFQFKSEQRIKASMDEIWHFISSPKNLKEITPEYMGFDISSEDLPDKMYPGMIIIYKVSPIFGIKITWVTEITHVENQKYFVDEQRMGPYSMWHHEHIIEPVNGGVLMKDIVTYRPPFGFLGSIANSILIHKKLKEIFEYRNKIIDQKFGTFSTQENPSS